MSEYTVQPHVAIPETFEPISILEVDAARERAYTECGICQKGILITPLDIPPEANVPDSIRSLFVHKKECECQRRPNLLNGMSFYGFESSLVEQYDLRHFDDLVSEQARETLTWYAAQVREIRKSGHGVLICAGRGEEPLLNTQGIGKTTLATVLAWMQYADAKEAQDDIMYIQRWKQFSEFVYRGLKAGHEGYNIHGRYEEVISLFDLDLLVIDDISEISEGVVPFFKDPMKGATVWLKNLVEHRYRKSKPTILVTDMTYALFMKKFPNKLFEKTYAIVDIISTRPLYKSTVPTLTK